MAHALKAANAMAQQHRILNHSIVFDTSDPFMPPDNNRRGFNLGALCVGNSRDRRRPNPHLSPVQAGVRRGLSNSRGM